jgi:hypothetical protein
MPDDKHGDETERSEACSSQGRRAQASLANCFGPMRRRKVREGSRRDTKDNRPTWPRMQTDEENES